MNIYGQQAERWSLIIATGIITDIMVITANLLDG